MVMQAPSFDVVGQNYGHFVVKRVEPIDELKCRLIELEHGPTGAQVMHIQNDDPENVFCLSLRTTPDSSNGVAHILEHTVLCGSEKFPVKDPFFAMIRRSLNTFMNAFTGADFTCYPAASQVPKDFYNLLEVYLDAVFHPKLNKLSFLQEGHRLEVAADNQTLEFHGVVFNEMKGAMSSPDSRLWEEINQSLYPDLTYGVNSGGDPKVIPDLTYEQLIEFHRTYYHPSRCIFYFYGNLPLEGHLDFLEKHALSGVDRVDPLEPIPAQPRHKSPVQKEAVFPIAANEDPSEKTMIAFAWLTTPISNQLEVLALTVLESVLMETDASPLKLALLKSGLCKQAMVHLDPECSEVPLLLLMKGCEAESADGLDQVIRETLEKLVKEGIPDDQLESAMHQLELHRSEISGDSYPYGLVLFMRAGLLKQHGIDPENGLRIHSLFAELREKFKDPKYLPSLIQKYMLDNPHRVRVIMKPDASLEEQEMKEEKQRLEAIRAGMDEKTIKEIARTADELKAFQDKQEGQDLEVLPKVALDDVNKEVKSYPLSTEKVGSTTVHHHECFTNDLAYLDLVFDLPNIPEADLPLAHLFLLFLTQIGAGSRDYRQNLEYIQAHTGGLVASGSLNLQASDPTAFRPSLQLRGKSLVRNVDKLCAVMKDMLTAPDVTDKERISELLHKHWSGLRGNLARRAMRYAMNLATSSLSEAGRVSDSWYGLDYYWAIQRIVKEFDENPDQLLQALTAMKDRLLTHCQPQLVVTGSEGLLEELKSHSLYGLEEFQTKAHESWQGGYSLPAPKMSGCLIAAPVAFTARSMQTVPYVDADSASLAIASYLFDNKVLHPQIREKGGAYGGGSSASALSGIFQFYSYRDPHLHRTLGAFQMAVDEIAAGKFDARDLEEAKLEMIQKLDSPVSPGARGFSAFAWLREGRSDEVRQAFRNRILACTIQEIRDAVAKHLAPKLGTAPMASFAGQELLDRENAALEAAGQGRLSIVEI